MFDSKCKTAFSLLCLLLMAFVAPVLAVDYKPGVSVGQYVKYSGCAVESLMELLDFDWTRLEVVDVSGKEVTLRSSGQLKNGTTINTSNLLQFNTLLKTRLKRA